MRRMHLAIVGLVAATAGGCSSEPEPPPTVKPWDCGVPQAYAVELTAKFHEVCLGDEQALSATVQWSCGAPETAAADATFTTSDPHVIAIEGDRARARGTGAAEIAAHAEGQRSAAMLVRVVRCADAGAGD